MLVEVDMDDPKVAEIVLEGVRKGYYILEGDDLAGPCFYIMAARHLGPVKCGISANLKARRQQLMTASGRNLQIAFSYPFASMAEAKKVERKVHIVLAAHRQRGEWFKLSPKRAIEAAQQIIASSSKI
jgi:Meiotically up-regulated gene 113